MNKLLAALLLATAAGTVLAEPVEGEVKKIDRGAGKITLKHGDIKNLDMPGMTMAFRVKDAKMMDGLAEGSKVTFEAEKINGQYTITRIAPR